MSRSRQDLILNDFATAFHRLIVLAMYAMPDDITDEKACQLVIERGYAQLDEAREKWTQVFRE